VVTQAGKDYFGRERNRPTRNVLVERCTITNGHAVSVGSETSGGIYNIHFKGAR
jgi:polygalacturonase